MEKTLPCPKCGATIVFTMSDAPTGVVVEFVCRRGGKSCPVDKIAKLKKAVLLARGVVH